LIQKLSYQTKGPLILDFYQDLLVGIDTHNVYCFRTKTLIDI